MTGLGQAATCSRTGACLTRRIWMRRYVLLRSVIAAYQQQYADNQNISFLPAIVSTSTRMHGEFLRLLFPSAPPPSFTQSPSPPRSLVCVMGRLVHTGLGSSSLVAHVLHYPPPHANSFVIGPAVINNTHPLLLATLVSRNIPFPRVR